LDGSEVSYALPEAFSPGTCEVRVLLFLVPSSSLSDNPPPQKVEEAAGQRFALFN